MTAPYPFQLTKMTPDHVEMQKRLFPHERSSMVESVIVKPGDVWMPKYFTQEVASKIYNFELRPDDVWIDTYPKCGTTWTQEMLWQIMNGCQFEMSKKVPLIVRSPFIDMEGMMSEKEIENEDEESKVMMRQLMVNAVNFCNEMQSPRLIKSHLALDMLNPKLLDTCKVVYVARNPKDCCVSYFHHTCLFDESYGYEGDFEDFAKIFLEGTLGFGGYFHHLKTAWKLKDHKNLKIIWFEDMKKDLIAVIRDVSQFLGKAMTEDQIEKLADHLQIDNFRKNVLETFPKSDTNDFQGKMVKFFRKGQVGDWKNYFTSDDNNDKWNKWIKDNLEGTDIKMRFE